jgi:iron complex outermembrane receptor protein
MYKMFNRLLNYKKSKYIQFYIVIGLLLSGNSFVCNATEKYYFQIPAMNAAPALDKLAVITGYSLIYPFDDSTIVVTNPIEGTYSVSDALRVLLLNTPISAIATKKGVIAVSYTLNKNHNNANYIASNILNEDVAVASLTKADPLISTQTTSKRSTKKVEVERVQIIGSRRITRSPSDALAPLDIINKQNLKSRGNSDIISTI